MVGGNRPGVRLHGLAAECLVDKLSDGWVGRFNRIRSGKQLGIDEFDKRRWFDWKLCCLDLDCDELFGGQFNKFWDN